jgi:crotonobetainyl-CoA:carnitine CoA-transferase CaiB-like acyl-CoA transferase
VPGALHNLRILDFSRVLAGPFATMLMGDLGADVIKVERPGAGDDTRSWGPPFDAGGEATYFLSVNRNKRSLELDLADEGDLRTARSLALRADALVENFRPGLMEKLGLGYEELRHENPRLVFCSITGFGHGEGAALPGYDLLVQAVGGLMSITGSPGGEPQKVGVALVDVLAGLFATVGILSALRHRELTGRGQRIDVTLMGALLSALVNQGSAYTVAGVVPGRMGNAHPSIAPYELFETGEGQLVLAVGTNRQFADLCAVIEAPDLAGDARFATNSERVAHRRELKSALEASLASRPARDWAELLTAARVPAGVVNDVAAAFSLAAQLGLAPIVTLAREDGEEVRLTRNPIGLADTPPEYVKPPPPLGGPDGNLGWLDD